MGKARRGGGWPNFVGIGLGMDIPVFNRKKGAIKAVQASIQQSETLTQQQEIEVANEDTDAVMNYTLLYDFHKTMIDASLTQALEKLTESYNRNLQNRNISLV